MAIAAFVISIVAFLFVFIALAGVGQLNDKLKGK